MSLSPAYSSDHGHGYSSWEGRGRGKKWVKKRGAEKSGCKDSPPPLRTVRLAED